MSLTNQLTKRSMRMWGAVKITASPTSRTVVEGVSTTFTVSCTGAIPVTIQWRRNGVNVGTNSTSYTVTPTMADNGATYQAVCSNLVGSVTSGTATLTVTAAPV